VSSIKQLRRRALRIAEAPTLPWRYFVAHPYAPLLVQIVVTRRCNLKCGYCNEFDRVSKPVPFERLKRTIDRVAELETRAIAFTGGEPLLHPDYPDIVRYAAARVARVSMSTNGYKLNAPLIRALGAAGLTRMQISLDGVAPTATTAKVLSCTRRKLELLSSLAAFPVTVNAVLGSIPLEETREVVLFAKKMGFETTVQWLHDADGQALNPHGVTADDIRGLARELALPTSHSAEVIETGLGNQPAWKCRAGARYLYVDEFSQAHFCSQALDLWTSSIDDVTEAQLKDNFERSKPCASHCTLGCVHDASQYDRWRPQRN
jgi:MoaA/NifB/PqqE/SkfB family radical SAM enzyme